MDFLVSDKIYVHFYIHFVLILNLKFFFVIFIHTNENIFYNHNSTSITHLKFCCKACFKDCKSKIVSFISFKVLVNFIFWMKFSISNSTVHLVFTMHQRNLFESLWTFKKLCQSYMGFKRDHYDSSRFNWEISSKFLLIFRLKCSSFYAFFVHPLILSILVSEPWYLFFKFNLPFYFMIICLNLNCLALVSPYIRWWAVVAMVMFRCSRWWSH